MDKPRFMKEGNAFIGEDEKWHIKDNAPDWAKNEFYKFFELVNPSPNENGKIG